MIPEIDRLAASSLPLLTPAEECELAQQMESADPDLAIAARDRFVASNYRLVISLVLSVRPLPQDIPDLLQDACGGLVRAVDKFDWRKGFRFSTYATWWINQAIGQSRRPSTRFPIPVHVVDHQVAVRQARQRLEAAGTRNPTTEQLAEESGYAVRLVARVENIPEMRSLDVPLTKAPHAGTLSDVIADADATAPFDAVENRVSAESLGPSLTRTLNDRERIVIEHRFGFGTGVPETYRAIGDHLGLSHERIRQIENKALSKLRHASFNLLRPAS